MLWFKVYPTDYNELLHTSRQCDCRVACKMSLWLIKHILNWGTATLGRISNSIESLVGRAPGPWYHQPFELLILRLIRYTRNQYSITINRIYFKIIIDYNNQNQVYFGFPSFKISNKLHSYPSGWIRFLSWSHALNLYRFLLTSTLDWISTATQKYVTQSPF